MTPPTPLERLAAELEALGRVVVAFSGGVDSALVARVAHDVLGPDRARAVTAVSPSLAASEREACARLAATWGLHWSEVTTSEMGDPRYRANASDRCYWCKSALMDVLEPLARPWGATVVLGVNLSDLTDHRPGQQAAAGRGARFPLVDAGFDKALVRATSAELGLPTADKPAAPCLASRVPYGTAVSVAVLGRVERAEAALRGLGFGDVRVRHHGARASVEVPLHDLPRLRASVERVEASVRAAGYRQVDIAPDGLRSGRLNAAIGS